MSGKQNTTTASWFMFFRKGKHERWVINGYQQEVVNSHTYLGYTFTTKLSVNRGLELITVRAKVDIWRALWRIGCTDVKLVSTYLIRKFKQP